jgi:hypothetical protein
LTRAGFADPFQVEGRSSIADLHKPGKRCGIYVFTFTNGDWYAGQAKDVTRRFVQHIKNHSDIATIRFRQVATNQLDHIEQDTIHSLEISGCKMRNIVFTCDVAGERDLDLLMSLSDQDEWLKGGDCKTKGSIRLNDQALHTRHRAKYHKWEQIPQTPDILNALHLYIQACIPAPQLTEAVFWSLTCLPGNKKPDSGVLNRINIYLQEVLSVYQNKSDPEIEYNFHLARSPLRKAFGPGLIRFRLQFPWTHISGHKYKPGGNDQISLTCYGHKAFVNLIQQTSVLSGIRLLNLRLMRKGANIWSRYHCLDLADKIFEDKLTNSFS